MKPAFILNSKDQKLVHKLYFEDQRLDKSQVHSSVILNPKAQKFATTTASTTDQLKQLLDLPRHDKNQLQTLPAHIVTIKDRKHAKAQLQALSVSIRRYKEQTIELKTLEDQMKDIIPRINYLTL